MEQNSQVEQPDDNDKYLEACLNFAQKMFQEGIINDE